MRTSAELLACRTPQILSASRSRHHGQPGRAHACELQPGCALPASLLFHACPLPRGCRRSVTYGELEPENQGREGNGVGPAAAAARAPMGHACTPPPVSLSRAAALDRSIAGRARRPPSGVAVKQRPRHSSSSCSLLAAKPLVEVGQGRLLNNHAVGVQHVVDLGGAREGTLNRDRQNRSPSAHRTMSKPHIKELSNAKDRSYGARSAAASQTATLNSSRPIAASLLLLQQQQQVFVLRAPARRWRC